MMRCSVETCSSPTQARGLCWRHYARARRAGRHAQDARFGDPATRFANKVRHGGPDGCHEWIGALSTNGYGMFWFERRQVAAHRWIFERLVGVVPDGLELDHLCHNRACVNLDHLEPVTHAENLRRRRRTVRGEGA